MKKVIISILALTMLTSGFGIAKVIPENFNYQNTSALYTQIAKDNTDEETNKERETISKEENNKENETHLKEVQISSFSSDDILDDHDLNQKASEIVQDKEITNESKEVKETDENLVQEENYTIGQEGQEEKEVEKDDIEEKELEKKEIKSLKDLIEKRKKHSPKKIENAFREKVKPRKKEKFLSNAILLSVNESTTSPSNDQLNKFSDSQKVIDTKKDNNDEIVDNNDYSNNTTQNLNVTALVNKGKNNTMPGDSALPSEREQDYCVTVIGNATSSMKPDKAYVTVQIETLDSDMKKSKDDNFALFDKTTDLLKDNGLNESDIVFDGFYSYPSYDYSGTRTLNGYYCQTTLTFAVNELENLQNLISVVSENGITKISNIRYETSTKDQVYSDVMLKALENAKEKAKNLTGKEDLSIKSIREESVYSSSCLYKSYYEGANIADFLGDIEVEARVVVEFE